MKKDTRDKLWEAVSNCRDSVSNVHITLLAWEAVADEGVFAAKTLVISSLRVREQAMVLGETKALLRKINSTIALLTEED